MFILRHSDLRDFFANAAWKGKIRKWEVVPIKNKIDITFRYIHKNLLAILYGIELFYNKSRKKSIAKGRRASG